MGTTVGYRIIRLTTGERVLVDAEDYPKVACLRWRRSGKPGNYYAQAYLGGRRFTPMHRLVLGLEIGDGKVVDHINRNTFDNRRANLRICSNRQNQMNKPASKGKRYSKYKGVCWHKRDQRWCAMIDGGKHLGNFDSELEAARAYDEAALRLYGEFAYFNFERKRA